MTIRKGPVMVGKARNGLGLILMGFAVLLSLLAEAVMTDEYRHHVTVREEGEFR